MGNAKELKKQMKNENIITGLDDERTKINYATAKELIKKQYQMVDLRKKTVNMFNTEIVRVRYHKNKKIKEIQDTIKQLESSIKRLVPKSAIPALRNEVRPLVGREKIVVSEERRRKVSALTTKMNAERKTKSINSTEQTTISNTQAEEQNETTSQKDKVQQEEMRS